MDGWKDDGWMVGWKEKQIGRCMVGQRVERG